MRVFIGYDPRPAEVAAFDVAAKTARRFGCEVIPLYEDRLRAAGILTRPTDRRGLMYDLNSDATQSTAFAISRFAVPILAHSGWALFADADFVFLHDPHEIERELDSSKAVMCVKHQLELPGTGTKMDGQQQQAYPRKLWSSFCAWNADHPSNRRLNLTTLNQWPGRDLHAFSWLHDDEIGSVDAGWNWLVGVQPKPADPKAAHFTLGCPSMAGYENCEHAEIWLEARNAA